jgi:hypothetical protein
MVDTVPFFVFHLENNYTKALFSIPPNLVAKVILHPVICRGSQFVLRQEEDDDNNRCYVAVEYQSADANGTAAAIARRLAIRLSDYVKRRPPKQVIPRLGALHRHDHAIIVSDNKEDYKYLVWSEENQDLEWSEV